MSKGAASICVTIILITLVAASQLLAHHAFSAEFDANRPVQLRGTVTKMEWINPHAWIHIDVKMDDGNVEQWMIEGGNAKHPLPSRLHQEIPGAGHGHHGRWLPSQGRHAKGQRSRPDV